MFAAGPLHIFEMLSLTMAEPAPFLRVHEAPVARRCKKSKGHGFKQNARAEAKRQARKHRRHG